LHALNCVRNLSAYFDKHMTREQHVKSNGWAAYGQLHSVEKLRTYIEQQSAEREWRMCKELPSHRKYCSCECFP